MQRALGTLALGFVLLLGRSPAAAQTTITTEPFASPYAVTGGGVQRWTWGQTFRAPNPTDLFLSSFRFSFGATPQVPYTVRLMEWDAVETRAGAVLFSQSSGATPTTEQYLTFEPGTLLRYGSDYIFAVSLAGASYFYAHTTEYNYDVRDPYPGGAANFIESDDLDVLQNETTRTWYDYDPSYDFDVGFTARFEPEASAVPEPASMALLGTGLIGLAASRRRKKRQAPED